VEIDSTFGTTPTIEAFARYRHTILARAGALLDPPAPAPADNRADTLPGVTGLLLASMEELKVAEEELRTQNTVLAARQAENDERCFHYRQLFLCSPIPTLVTDVHGSVIEINLAAAALFRREARWLEGKPLAVLLGASLRDEFRQQLKRVTLQSEPTTWRLALNRVGDIPVNVEAIVSLVPDLGVTKSGILYWALRVVPHDD
jgi:PAS domain-containing protein